LPSQQQVRWSELRVGITVIVASVTLAILIFLMSGNVGLFSQKLVLRSYFENTGGLRIGAPVNLQGVNEGNVSAIRIVQGRQLTPVEVTMKVGTKYQFLIRKDTRATLSTAGVLGDVFVDLDSKNAHGPPAENNDELSTLESPDIQDMIKAGQGTLQNMDVLIKRLDRIVADIEQGNGSIGKVLKDPSLFNRANDILGQMQSMLNKVNNGQGSIGKLLNDDELYQKVNTSVDKLNKIVDDINAGKGNAGKFLKDESLYKNANETIAKANKLVGDINEGKGTLGKFAHDEEFAKKIDNTVTKLNELADKLNSGQGTVGQMIVNPSLYNNADQMLVESRNLVKAIRENPKKYLTIHFKLF
jgi:phospholipid/cholesterol/gamma-HCH transport system substrate-binding protein